jgi:hypothetical protein
MQNPPFKSKPTPNNQNLPYFKMAHSIENQYISIGDNEEAKQHTMTRKRGAFSSTFTCGTGRFQ